jgi:hypothetical protein
MTRFGGKTWLWIACLSCGCGSSARPSSLPYASDTTTVIGGSSSSTGGSAGTGSSVSTGTGAGAGGTDGSGALSTAATPNGDQCLMIDGQCVKPQASCGDNGRADVLLDANGMVINTLCYPTGGVSVESFDGPVHDVGNNVVLVVDDKNDGVDVMGDVTIDGNNVTLYGYGPLVSVLGGNLNIDKNNARVRGVRVQGNVTIDKNNPSIVDCVIEGDLTIKGNNVSVALCEIWGKVTVLGNNAMLIANKLREPPVVSGQNLVCNQDILFTDNNGDSMISSNELGAAVSCTNKVAATTGNGKMPGKP